MHQDLVADLHVGQVARAVAVHVAHDDPRIAHVERDGLALERATVMVCACHGHVDGAGADCGNGASHDERATTLGVVRSAVLTLLPVLGLAVAMAVAAAVLCRRGGGEGDRRANAQRDEWPVDSDPHLASFDNRAASSEAPCCASPPRDGFAISRSELLLCSSTPGTVRGSNVGSGSGRSLDDCDGVRGGMAPPQKARPVGLVLDSGNVFGGSGHHMKCPDALVWC